MKNPKNILLKIVIVTFLFILVFGCSKFSDGQWSTKGGGNDSAIGKAIAADENGITYVTGSFREFASFGPHILTSSGDKDIFIAKMDASGKWIQAIKAGGRNSDFGEAVTVDEKGNTYVTGSFHGKAEFGSKRLTSDGDSDIFVAKINSLGYCVWAVKAGGRFEDTGRAITVDENGNTIITGSFSSKATFGFHHVSCPGRMAIFVASLDEDGNWTWATQSGGTGGYGIATDSFSNIFITGYFYKTANFGSTTLSTNDPYDMFVAKMDIFGKWVWATKIGRAGNVEKTAITTDHVGNSYITGSYYTTASFGHDRLTCIGGCNMFVAKIDTNGNWLWAKQSDGMGPSYGNGIALDDSGDVYVAGFFSNSVTFGSHSFKSNRYDKAYVAKMDDTGKWLWVKDFGGESYVNVYGIAIEKSGNINITGSINNSVIFGSHSFKN